MKNKNVLIVGFLSIIVFIGFASYYWYLYFKKYEGEVLDKNVRIELVNNGNVDYINAIPNDDEEKIPTYYFRIKNGVDVIVNYNVYIKDVSAKDVNDGCTDEMLFKRDELRYELKFDNRVIKTGLLSELNNNLLDTNKVDRMGFNDYSLRIWLDDETQASLAKHYHYIVYIEEKNEIVY